MVFSCIFLAFLPWIADYGLAVFTAFLSFTNDGFTAGLWPIESRFSVFFWRAVRGVACCCFTGELVSDFFEGAIGEIFYDFEGDNAFEYEDGTEWSGSSRGL